MNITNYGSIHGVGIAVHDRALSDKSTRALLGLKHPHIAVYAASQLANDNAMPVASVLHRRSGIRHAWKRVTLGNISDIADRGVMADCVAVQHKLYAAYSELLIQERGANLGPLNLVRLDTACKGACIASTHERAISRMRHYQSGSDDTRG